MAYEVAILQPLRCELAISEVGSEIPSSITFSVTDGVAKSFMGQSSFHGFMLYQIAAYPQNAQEPQEEVGGVSNAVY